MNNREITWQANQYLFEQEVEKLLATCPNMMGEDDKRDLCEQKECPLYTYCISIEPAEVPPGLKWDEPQSNNEKRIYKEPRCCGRRARKIYIQVTLPKRAMVPIGYICVKCGTPYITEDWIPRL